MRISIFHAIRAAPGFLRRAHMGKAVRPRDGWRVQLPHPRNRLQARTIIKADSEDVNMFSNLLFYLARYREDRARRRYALGDIMRNGWRCRWITEAQARTHGRDAWKKAAAGYNSDGHGAPTARAGLR